MKKYLNLLVVFLFLLTFSGCNMLNSNSEVLSSQSETTGVIYLGNYESYEECINGIKASDDFAEYAFSQDLNEEDFFSASNGTETFAIIPDESAVSLCVYELKYDENLDKTQKGQLLYQSSQAGPVIVKCNWSDIFPDAQIVITDNDGAVTEFTLQLSMKDGSLEIISDKKDAIKDLTK